MGENEGLVWLLLAFVGLLAVGIEFAQAFDIDASLFFRNVTVIEIK